MIASGRKYLGEQLRIEACRESDDVTALVVYDGSGRYVGRLARLDHPEGDWSLLEELAWKLHPAVLDAIWDSGNPQNDSDAG